MNISWCTRSFLDYRLPVFAALDNLCGHSLTLIFNKDVVPTNLSLKAKQLLGDRAIGLAGEWRFGNTGNGNVTTEYANRGIRLPYQPSLIRTLQKTEPEVMLSDGFMQWTYAPLWQRFWNKTPHVMCYERTAHTERNCQWYRRVYRKFAMRCIDAYCANGRLCGEYLQSLGAKPEHIFYGHMASDTEGLTKIITSLSDAKRKELRAQFPVSGKLFLYVGQVIPRKGVKQLLDAWEQWKPINDGLLIVGDGQERSDLEKRELNNVFWIGKQPYEKIAEYYDIADLFVMPTLEDNWSLVVPEAMACGKPIICSAYNGCWPELVTQDNGWVFDPLNPAETLQVLCKTASLPLSELKARGEKSKQIVARFSPSYAARSIYQACQKALKTGKHS